MHQQHLDQSSFELGNSRPSLAAPKTPMDDQHVVPPSPRQAFTTQSHGPDSGDDVSKRARVETAKKQKVNALMAEQQQMIRVVKFGSEEYHTMDEYSTDFNDEVQEEDGQDLWKDETELQFAGVPEALWA